MKTSWLGLENKVIVITGGTSGIGKHLAKTLGKEGATIVIADHQVKTGEIREGAYCVHCDVIRKDSAGEMVQTVVKKFGRLDVLVNCVGIQVERSLVDAAGTHPERELDETAFAMMWGVNVKSVYICAQASVRQMLRQKSGVIVNVCVSTADTSKEGQSVYAATKGAVEGLTQGWARELEAHQIRVVGCTAQGKALEKTRYEGAMSVLRGVYGAAYSSVLPLGQEGKTGGIGDLVAYLISDKANGITGVTVELSQDSAEK